jgi:flagellar basal-body rod protein FlgF
VDRLIYTAMTGAKHVFNQQAGVAHNLANATTTGYRAQEHKFRAVPIQSEAMPTRAFVVDASIADDYSQGPLAFTGRSLDVAVQGRGWIAVEGADGKEAYTRVGALQINPNGLLQSKAGLNVVGDGGPISVPPDSKVTIASDGTISVLPESGAQNAVNALGRLKLVNPPEADLVRGDDGLFRLRNGTSAPQDDNVRVATESLEGSNVNVVESMVSMISLARQFEMQVKMLQNADANARQAGQVLSMNR